MYKLEYLTQITESAKRYKKISLESIQRNQHMHKLEANCKIDQTTIDVILVDFINYIGNEQCVDYALYASDLDD